MRIFGLEITKAPNKSNKRIWSRAAIAPLGLLVRDMTAAELRRELSWVIDELSVGKTLYIGSRDQFKRVQSK